MDRLRGKIKELKERSFICKILINKWTIVTLIFLSIVCVFDRNNIFQLAKTNQTLRNQKKQELYLKNAIRTSDHKIEQIKSNLDTLEMFARENYYFQESGEDVYIVK